MIRYVCSRAKSWWHQKRTPTFVLDLHQLNDAMTIAGNRAFQAEVTRQFCRQFRSSAVPIIDTSISMTMLSQPDLTIDGYRVEMRES